MEVDLVFTSRPLSWKPISWVNSVARAVTSCPYDHVCVLVRGRLFRKVYESSAPNGVQSLHYLDWIKNREGTYLTVYRTKIDYQDVLRYHLKSRGVKYDYKANVLWLFRLKSRLKLKANKRLYCSEYVANIMGLPKPYEKSPAGIWESVKDNRIWVKKI